MPGAWEQATPEVLVVILTREFVNIKWAMSARMWNLPAGHEICVLSGMPFDHARNVGCSKAIQGGFKYVFFIDDDVIIPNDAFQRLSAHNKEVVSGLYYRRNLPLTPCMSRDVNGIPTWVQEFPDKSLIEVDLVGAGCMLIRSEILSRLGIAPFEWRSDRYDLPELDRTSEDFTFCRRVTRELGLKIHVDTSVICPHIGFSQSLGGQLAPCTMG